MSEPFVRRFHVRWGDIDFNSHMRNTAYLDVSGDLRMLYFEANGFTMDEFRRSQLGPVILKDELDYSRELRLLEPFDVSLLLAALAEDGSRFRLHNDFLTVEGRLAARVTSTGGWLDLASRKLIAPPGALLSAIDRLPRADGFETLRRPVRLKGGEGDA